MASIPTPMKVRCTCGKRFNSPAALADHQRDSPRHNRASSSAAASAITNPTTERISENAPLLVEEDVNERFIPFAGGEKPPLLSSATARTGLSYTPIAFVREGTGAGSNRKAGPGGTKSKKSKKRATGTASGGWGEGGGSSWSVDMMEDQNWALCDKDCGWCGYCAERVDY